MKRKLFLAMVSIGLIVASCTGFKAHYVQLTQELMSFTSLSENGDTLCGVRTKDGKVVIQPKVGVRYAVDKAYHSIIFEIDKNNPKIIRYFTLKGEPLSDEPLKGLTHYTGQFPSADELVYVGQAKNGLYHGYFVNTGEVFTCKGFTAENSCGYIGMQQDDSFSVYTLKGTKTWTVEGKDVFWAYRRYPGKPRIVVLEKYTAKIYNLEGGSEGSKTAREWNNIIKGKETKNAGDVKVVFLDDEI